MARIVSVNAGRAETVTFSGRTFATAILKRPIAGTTEVRGANVDGDDQADREVHGGPSKAVYVYASEDYAYWRSTGRDFAFGTLGENLTTAGVDVNDLHIGERWRAGTALLEVSEPRIPCYKLGYASGDVGFPKAFAAALRGGAYFRIVEEGVVAAGDAFVQVAMPRPEAPTVREIARLRLFSGRDRSRTNRP